MSQLDAVDLMRDPLMIELRLYDTLQRYLPEVRQFDWIQCPCGKCAACRQSNAQVWADRLMMELPYTDQPSSFLTLTYDDAHVPLSYTVSPWSGRLEWCYPLDVRDFQLFMKSLREKIHRPGLRFLASAEYGGKYHRPHFHVALVGYRAEDLKFYKLDRGYSYYTSEDLCKIWKRGFVVSTDLTAASGAYVARYMTEKWEARDYKLYAAETARLGFEPLPAQKLIMSRRPGLGRHYLEDHSAAVLRDDLIVPARGSAGSRTVPAFRYALNVLSEDQQQDLKDRRANRAPREILTDQSLTEQAEAEALRLQRHIKKRKL